MHFAEYLFHLLHPHLSAVCKQQNMKNNAKLKIYKSKMMHLFLASVLLMPMLSTLSNIRYTWLGLL